jgi:hypothetical protein
MAFVDIEVTISIKIRTIIMGMLDKIGKCHLKNFSYLTRKTIYSTLNFGWWKLGVKIVVAIDFCATGAHPYPSDYFKDHFDNQIRLSSQWQGAALGEKQNLSRKSSARRNPFVASAAYACFWAQEKFVGSSSS